ncbi:MAG: hypothetical protein AAF081_17235 [Actinomycetota bacterium]
MSFGLAPHIVGDSTAELATLEVGYGSGFPGRGFVSSAHVIYGGDTPYLNPLLPAPDGDVPVVGFVSIWDGLVTDFDGYVDATRQYPQGVIWVEVPPFSSDSRIVDPTLVELNARVADALGCDIIPWRWRDVDTKDGIHPSDAGVEELIMRMTVLAEFAEPCVIESTPPPGVR